MKKMRRKYFRLPSTLAGALLSGALFLGASLELALTANAQEDVLPPVTAKTNLYPTDADANKEIAEALKRATVEHKRVMLIFGGNWCYDCHVLDQALHSGEAGQVVKESYLLVHVDIGEGDKNLDLVKKYRIPLDKGVPALAVLKSDGELIYWSGYGEFEAARSMTKKLLVGFLNHWKESTP